MISEKRVIRAVLIAYGIIALLFSLLIASTIVGAEEAQKPDTCLRTSDEVINHYIGPDNKGISYEMEGMPVLFLLLKDWTGVLAVKETGTLCFKIKPLSHPEAMKMLDAVHQDYGFFRFCRGMEV